MGTSFYSSRARFHTTMWDVVRAAGDRADPGREEALEVLCGSYWYPLYAFLRRRGEAPEDAADLVQGLFASLLERGDLDGLDPEGGRFRSYLLAALKHHASDQRDRARAQKRGGGRAALSLDASFEPAAAEERFRGEPRDERSPEGLFERDWALAVLARALARLEQEQTERRRGPIFARLRGFLDGVAEGDSHAAAATDLGLSSGAVKVAVHRLRARYRELLLAEVAATVAPGDDAEAELRALVAALGAG